MLIIWKCVAFTVNQIQDISRLGARSKDSLKKLKVSKYDLYLQTMLLLYCEVNMSVANRSKEGEQAHQVSLANPY